MHAQDESESEHFAHAQPPFCLTWPVCYVMKVLFGYVPLFIDKHIIVLRPLKIIEYNTLI